MCKQLVVIQSDDPLEFQRSLNSKLRELEECDPQIEFHHGVGYCAYLIYSDKDEINGIVKPVNPCLCDSCMKCLEPPRRRAKWRKCAIFGSVHGKKECDRYVEVMM